MDNRLLKLLILFLALSLLFWNCRQTEEFSNPAETVELIIDNVVNTTEWDFQFVPQKTVLGVQIIDFGRTYNLRKNSVAYGLSYLKAEKDTTISFGLDHTAPLKIWINNKPVYVNPKDSDIEFEEIAYGMIEFPASFKANLQAGHNKILVKSVCSNSRWQFVIRPITEDLMHEGSVDFSLDPLNSQNISADWLCAGPFDGEGKNLDKILDLQFPPEEEIKPVCLFSNNEYRFNWTIPQKNTLAKINSPYEDWAYNGWHYSIGALMMAILDYSEIEATPDYTNYVQKYTDFVNKHKKYFRWQYEDLLALRGSYHRLFRKNMLDDTGAPALSFISLALKNNSSEYSQIIEPVASYIMEEQIRLEDGTLCRPEPVKYTVWADDLFMSVPFLLRMAELSGEEQYYDEATSQIISFTEKLYNEEKELFHHGWFSKTSSCSPVFWGRANGWVVWAIGEALSILPEEHPDYSRIKQIYQKHLNGLIQFQDESGMWHQVLDHPESFAETSSTAMFTLGLARGIREGWLSRDLTDNALLAWQGLQKYISEEGVVSSICKGTGIGKTLEFYFTRPTYPNDPRGLGAVIYAGMEIKKLNEFIKNEQ